MSDRKSPGRLERSASVDSPTASTLQGEVSFGDNSPLIGVLLPSQRHALHLSLAAAAQEASGADSREEQMPLRWDLVEQYIAEGKTTWIQELRRDHLLEVCKRLRVNATDEKTIDELRVILREFVKSKIQGRPAPTTSQAAPRQNQNTGVNQTLADMAENSLTVRRVLKDIEILDSNDRGKVCDFIHSCRYARKTIRPADMENLLEAILSARIKGPAAEPWNINQLKRGKLWRKSSSQ